MSKNIDPLSLLYQNRMESINQKDHIKDCRGKQDKYISLFHEIRNLLPEEKKGLISDLDSETGAWLGDYEEVGYKTGFNDAVKLFTKGLAGVF